jgi:pilus assembly protein TadC
MYSFLANFYPKKTKAAFYKLLDYFDLQVRKEFVMGSLFFFTIGITLSFALQFSTSLLKTIPSMLSLFLVWIGSFVLIHLIIYSILSIIALNRGRFIEGILPDALELISANLRAGLTIDRALVASNRKEFGYLNYLLNIVGKEVSTGKSVTDALMDMTKKVNSEKFSRTMELITTAMKSGGELSKLLGQVAENLIHQKNIEDKIKAGVSTYLIFIGAAVSFAAPFLYGLSSVFVDIIISSFSSVEIPPNAQMPFSLSLSKDMAAFLPGYVRFYATMSLSTLAIMSSFLLGLIKRGKAKFGIVYIPFILGMSMLTYIGISFGAQYLFSSIQ